MTRLVVVGGVAGGMSCAARARRLDETCDITVVERGAFVSFANCGLPYHVSGEIDDAADLMVETPESLRAMLGIEVLTNTEVTALDPDGHTVTLRGPDGVRTLDYDALVLSPGGVPVRPPIEGLGSTRVHTLRTVPDATGLRRVLADGARRAVVLGAGFIGLEVAEAFVLQGLDTHLVELAPQVLPPLDPEIAGGVASELRTMGMSLHLGVGATRIEHFDDHDVVELSDGTTLQADVIVLSTGVRPDTAVFETAGVACDRGAIVVDEHGATSLPHIWAVGDATVSTDAVTGLHRVVALAGPANRAGRQVADAILSPEVARPIPPTVATAIVRVGESTVAVTGANAAQLDQAGIAHHTIHLVANDHAGYFPGATRITLVVHFATDDGRILGAQAIGAKGVDKRIDVLATAIRGGLTVDDLIDLDLAYSPPYGSAKDPVNLAGMVAANVASGALKLWYPHQLDEVAATSLLVDVRNPDEVATGTLRGALVVPMPEVRERIGEITEAAGGRPVRVFCASGKRSASAHRILAAAGVDSASLSGGLSVLTMALADRVDEVVAIPEVAGV